MKWPVGHCIYGQSKTVAKARLQSFGYATWRLLLSKLKRGTT